MFVRMGGKFVFAHTGRRTSTLFAFQVRVAYGRRYRGHAHSCMFRSYNHVPGDKIDLAVLALSVCQCNLSLVPVLSLFAVHFLEGLDHVSLLVTVQH